MGEAKKSHDTLIDWRTGREWPLNCMTVISAWWRLNMRFQRSSGRSSRHWTIIYLSWVRVPVAVAVELETERDEMWQGKPHPAEGVLGNPDGVWDPEKMLIRCSKESQHPAEWTPGTPVEHQNEKDTVLTAIRMGVRILQFLFGLQLLLTRKPWITFSNPCNIVRVIYIYKEIFLRLSLLLCRYDTAHENITHSLVLFDP